MKNYINSVFLALILVAFAMAIPSIVKAQVNGGDDATSPVVVTSNSSTSNGGDDVVVTQTTNGSDDSVKSKTSNGLDDSSKSNTTNGGDDKSNSSTTNGSDDSAKSSTTNGGDDAVKSNTTNGSDDKSNSSTSNGKDDVGTNNPTNPGTSTGGGNNNSGSNQTGGGGSGGGSSSGSRSGGGGRSILATSSIAPIINTSGCSYLTTFMKMGIENDSAEVTKLQTFLKNVEKLDVDINGTFDQKTLDAVKAFQEKYIDETMLPWGVTTPTGQVFYTTQKKINEIVCKTTLALTSEQLSAIEAYKKGILDGTITIDENGEIINNATGTDSLSPEVGSNDNSLTASAGGASIVSRIWSFIKWLFGY